jgi:hypothetical protein
MSPETPSRPGCDSVPCSPKGVLGYASTMESFDWLGRVPAWGRRRPRRRGSRRRHYDTFPRRAENKSLLRTGLPFVDLGESMRRPVPIARDRPPTGPLKLTQLLVKSHLLRCGSGQLSPPCLVGRRICCARRRGDDVVGLCPPVRPRHELVAFIPQLLGADGTH